MSQEDNLEAIKSERDYYLKVISDAQEVLSDWIVPSSTMNNADALDRLTGILDNRELVLKMRGLTEPEGIFTLAEFSLLIAQFNNTIGTSPSETTRLFTIKLRCFAIITANTGNISSGSHNAPRRFFKTFKEAERAAEELVANSNQWHRHGLFIVQIVGKTTAVKAQTTRVIDEDCCPDEED